MGKPLWRSSKQLRAAGCRKVYREKASGARADRRQLQRLLKALDRDDTIIVTRIDRLARSTFDLFAIIQRIVDSGAPKALIEKYGRTTLEGVFLEVARHGARQGGAS